MTIGFRILVATMLGLLPACQQEATSRSKAAVINGASSALLFKIDGDFKPESVRGYLLNYADKLIVLPDASPTFKIDDVENGTYKLWVFAESSEGKKLASETIVTDFKKGQAAISVKLAETATISGSLIGDETQIKTMTAGILGSDFQTTPGDDFTFSFEGLPATQMTLIVTNTGGARVHGSEVITEAGKTTTLSPIDLTNAQPVTVDPAAGGEDPVTPTSTAKLSGGALILNNGDGKTGSLTVPVTFVTPQGATEVLISEDISMPGSWQSIPSSYSHTFSSTGQKTLYAKYRSKAGVESDKVYATVDINTTVPTPGTVTLVNGSTFTKNRLVSFSVTATGVSKMKFALSQAALTAASFTSYSAFFNNFDLGDDLPGVHTVWFQFQSEYGIPSVPQSVNISVVNTGPSISSFVTKTGELYYRTKDVLFTITAGTKPFDVAFYQASCDNVEFKRSSFSESAPDVTLDVTSSLLGCTTTQGSRTITVFLEDSLGNIGPPQSTVVNYDTTPPGTPIIDQVSGTTTSNAAITISGSTEASASVTVSGGVTPVTVSANGSGIYSTSVTLNANASNTLTVQSSDAAGNLSPIASFTVTQDSIAPTITSGPFVRLTGESISLVWDTSEPVSVVIDYGLNASYGFQSIDAALKTTHDTMIDNLGQNTIYHYRITITDLAGNSFSSTDASARTYIDKSATLAIDEIWEQTDTPFYVSGNFRIDPGYTVRIKKGVTIAMDVGTKIWVKGTLIAEGTAAEPVVFTTNDPQPTAGVWDRIEFNDTTASAYSEPHVYTGGSRLDHVIVEYGGSSGQSILIKQQSASITNTTIRNSKYYAVIVEDMSGTGSVSIRNNRFESNEGAIKTHLYDSGILGQTVFITDNIFKNNLGKVLDLQTFSTAVVERNQILSNSQGMYFGSIDATVENNIFNKTPSTFVLEPESANPLNLTIRKNAILTATGFSSTVLADADGLVGTQSIYNLSFTENTLHDNKVLDAGDSLIVLDHPDTYSALDPIGTVAFTNNNFINNNVGQTGVYVMMAKSSLHHPDIPAQNNYWGTLNQLVVQQQYIYDFTDFGDYRSIAYTPVLTKHRESAPISPPRDLTVTSPAAGTAEISWTINDEGDTGGYFLYYSPTADAPLAGTGASQGPSKIDTESGAVTCNTVVTTKTCTLTGLTPASTYYFTVTAYDGGDKAVQSFTEPGPTNTGTDTITITNHGFKDGQRVRMDTVVGGVLPTGISSTQNYWITRIDANTIKLRTTEAAGSDIDITGAGTNTCKVIPNLPFKTLDYVENIISSVNVANDRLTFTDHGYKNGVRGTLAAVGTYLGLDTTTEYFVTSLDANTFLLSVDGAGVSLLDIGLDNGYKVINQDIDFTTDIVSVQNHKFTNGTEIQFTTTGTLPTPLATVTNYYVVNATTHTFQVSASFGGLSIDMIDPINNDTHTITPTTPGAGSITFTPNYPDISRQDFQFLGNESWYATEVSTTVN